MSLASSVALVVVLIASTLGWWSGRRLTTAANLEQLRRRARWSLAAGVVLVGAGSVQVGTGMLRWSDGGPGWAEPVRISLLAIPVLVTLAITIPRTWVVVRSRRSADPLHWPDGRLRFEAAGPELVVPFAAALLGGLAVVLVPGTAPSVIQVSIAALAVLAATTVIDTRQRQHRAMIAAWTSPPTHERASW